MKELNIFSKINRWSPQRKEAIVTAIKKGEISFEQAYQIHGLSEEELTTWQDKISQGGCSALTNRRMREFRK
jgi:transposase-like protein